MTQIISDLKKIIKRLLSSEKPSTNPQTISSNHKKPDIELLLASPNLNSSIIELDDYICALCEWGDNLSALSNPQKVFYFNQELEREINNGGFDQYFHNTSGNYANDTIETLKLIGAIKTAKILQAAIEIFPDKKVPVNRNLRQNVMEDIEDTNKEHWNKLDQQFFKYEDDLNTLNIEFVRKNKQYF
jgi:hypothetical protein